MCYTWRHDYGLDEPSNTNPFNAGMTSSQRNLLWKQMAQLFDNDIAPFMEFKAK